jgi:hypothetical protein
MPFLLYFDYTQVIKSVPFKIRAPLLYNGTCKANTSFVIKVDSRNDDEATGTIEWQNNPPTITKWKGTVCVRYHSLSFIHFW